METSEVLNTAADLIEERGWTSGGGWNGDGALCLEGAISAAMGFGEEFERVWSCPAASAVQSYLSEWVTAQKGLYLWNDQLRHGLKPDGTVTHLWPGGSSESATQYAAQKVIEVLRAAAVIEAAKEQESAEVSA